MIIGAFIIDLLLLALTLFVGQVLSDNLNAGSRTIAFQQSLFLNAFALIEFFKTVLRLIFAQTWLNCARSRFMTRPPVTGVVA